MLEKPRTFSLPFKILENLDKIHFKHKTHEFLRSGILNCRINSCISRTHVVSRTQPYLSLDFETFSPCCIYGVFSLAFFFCSLYIRKEVRVVCYCECFPLILRAVLRLLKHLIKALLCLGADMGR